MPFKPLAMASHCINPNIVVILKLLKISHIIVLLWHLKYNSGFFPHYFSFTGFNWNLVYTYVFVLVS